jgi:hypothetical protein
MIPLPILLIIWTAATITSTSAAVAAHRADIKSMSFAFAGFALGAFSVWTFYSLLMFTDIAGNLGITIPWSRWVHAINGLILLSASVAVLIVVKDR